MDIRHITPTYAVSPQISCEDMKAIAAAGFKTVICNRPDIEVPPSQQEDAIRDAAERLGLYFVSLPVTHAGLTKETVTRQKETYETSVGPTLAYCASGTRSSIVWALGQAAEHAADDILTSLSKAGYQLPQLRPQLDALYLKSD
jgi:uncharacterized protein (TIGR01244 family)